MIDESAPRVAIACYWSPHFALVLLHGKQVASLRRIRLEKGPLWAEQFRDYVYRYFEEHRPDELIIEARTAHRLAVRAGGIIRVVSASDAKGTLLPGVRRPTLRMLYDTLLAEDPRLAALVTIDPTMGLAADKSWQVVTLLAVAIGLAARGKSNVCPASR